MSYVEGRCGRELRALPGVRCCFPLLCDSNRCEPCNVGGVEIVGAAGSGTLDSGAGSDGPSAGPPNENPKSTALISRVLYHQLARDAYVMVSRGRGAPTQLRAVAFVAAPLAL